MSDDLVTWLRAKIDADERVAREVESPGKWDAAHGADGSGVYMFMDRRVFEGRRNDVEHAGRHDPARVLREVEAKRQIIASIVDRTNPDEDEAYNWEAIDAQTDGMGSTVLCLLALPYADRPGYRDEWRP